MRMKRRYDIVDLTHFAYIPVSNALHSAQRFSSSFANIYWFPWQLGARFFTPLSRTDAFYANLNQLS